MKSLRSAILLAVICLSATPRGAGSTQGAPDRAPVFGAPTNESQLSPVDPLNFDLARLLSLIGFIKTKSILIASKVCDMQTRITDIQTMIGGVISTAIDDILSKVCDIQTRAEDIDTKVDDVQMRVPIIESKVCDIQTRVEDIDTQVDDIFVRVPVIESKVCDIQTRVLDVDTHIDDILTKVCDIDTKVDHLFDESCPNLIRQSDMPFTISSPGFYCLAEDVSFSSGSAGICIDADCVVFDLNSHSITNGLGGGGSAVEVAANRAHIKIRNGTIVGTGIAFDFGVELASTSSFISVCNLRVRDSFIGFSIEGSSQAVRDCVASCASAAFFVAGGSDIIFEDCIAFESLTVAFSFLSGSSVCALRCQAFNTGGDGFCVNSGNSLLRNCISKGAGSCGFRVQNTGGTVVEECVAIGSSIDGFQVAVDDVAILGCVAENNADDGIVINAGVNGVILKENQCHHNGGFGIFVDVIAGFGGEIVNNFAFDNAGGNFSPFVPASCQGIAPKPMVEDTLSKVCELRELACTNLISQSDMNPTFTITSPGLYCLTEDVSFSPASAGILIDADCVVLDLNSHSITVPASGRGVEVAANRAHIKIRNGKIVGNGTLDRGVELASTSSFVSVCNIRVRDSFIGFGIGGSEQMLRECAASCPSCAFLVVASATVLDRCQAYEATIGFAVFSDLVCFLGCVALDCSGNGFLLNGNSNLLRGCVAKKAGGNNFIVGAANATNNLLQECVAFNGGISGFQISGPDQSLIGCVAENNAIDGIRVSAGFDRIVLKETYARNNGANGIRIDGADACGIEGCHCSGNTADGIVLSAPSNNCVIKNCVIEANGDVGIDFLNTSTFCIVRDNDLTNNASFAIRDAITNQNHILHNFASGNNGGGDNYSGVDPSIIIGLVPAAGGPFDNFSNTGA